MLEWSNKLHSSRMAKVPVCSFVLQIISTSACSVLHEEVVIIWFTFSYMSIICTISAEKVPLLFFDLNGAQSDRVQRKCLRAGKRAVSQLNRLIYIQKKKKKRVASMAGDHYWFIHWKQFFLAQSTWQVGVWLCVSSFYISSVSAWAWVREPASACAE